MNCAVRYHISDYTVVSQTALALLVDHNEQQAWLPKSQINGDWRKAQILDIPHWLAVKAGFAERLEY